MIRPKVMPIGDSITFGLNSTTMGGYRSEIFSRSYNGIPYVSRGASSSGGFGENRYCGLSGERTDEVLARLQTEAGIFVPDVALYHVGTNDCTQRNSGVAPPPTEAQSVQYVMDSLDLLRAANAQMRVIVALILPNQTAGADAQITSFNTALETAVLLRTDYTNGYIRIANMNAAFRANINWATDYMGDVTHPNAAGYAVMAATWATQLTAFGF